MRSERVQLGDVDLHCWVAGEGPLVILAHGFPDEPMTFRAQLEALAEAGFRAVAPAMRGYAPSGEARSHRYDPTATGDDLLALADHYAKDEKVRIVGHDWGAVAAFSAAAGAPDRISHLVTMAVPHMRALLPHFSRSEQIQRSWYMAMFQIPVYAERRLAEHDLALVDRLFSDWSPGYVPTEDELAAIKAAIRPRIPAVIAYYRALTSPSRWLGTDRERLFAHVRVPSMHLHGADDGCIGIECCEGAEAFYDAGYRFVRLEGAGHFTTREVPDAVNRELLAFFA